jgi:predicted PilT family ATPase
MKILNDKIEELEKQMKAIDAKILRMSSFSNAPSNDSHQNIDSSQIDQMMQSLKAEFQGIFAKQEDLQGLVKRVQNLEGLTQTLKEANEKIQEKTSELDKRTEDNTVEINKLKELIKGLESKLSNKVECEDYDKLVALINQIKVG